MEDLISRQSALDILDDFQSNIELGIDDYAEKRKALCDLPSADRPIGHWIYKRMRGIKTCKCSECLTSYGCMDTPYCPNCGADMRGGNDEIR